MQRARFQDNCSIFHPSFAKISFLQWPVSHFRAIRVSSMAFVVANSLINNAGARLNETLHAKPNDIGRYAKSRCDNGGASRFSSHTKYPE
jgi:hypothetical protein